MNFPDHFSGHAAAYAQARPTYPPALFDWLAAQCTQRVSAWDAGCGNGQAAVALAAHFARVIATDPSAAQIANAIAHPQVEYRVEPAEAPTLAAHSVDLVTVAQAFHWFDSARFIAAARRVLRPQAVIAVWSYGLSEVAPAIDRVFMQLYDGRLGPYWPPERRHVEEGYASLPFPFTRIEAPAFTMHCHWTLPQYLDYLRSWSATQRCVAATGADPVSAMADDFAQAWGDPSQPRTVRWPLALRAGRAD